ncbi:helix-turn-helix transcriptional regulator [Streptosporangium sandarakinum]|uniref:helix-turn-helix transcriptional regulator n=1 Tax=Streptosporangium sandarakinum TaxID=1260955 RepID=UPI0036CB1E6C
MARTTGSERLWSHEETATFLDVSPWTLHKWNSAGTGPKSYKLGKHRKYAPQDVYAWLETRASVSGGVAA